MTSVDSEAAPNNGRAMDSRWNFVGLCTGLDGLRTELR
jgi:hypothetical protein